MGAPQGVKVLSIPTLSYPLPTSLPYFLQESLPVCHIHHLVLCNESPPNSIAESAKNKNQACHSGVGVQRRREECSHKAILAL